MRNGHFFWDALDIQIVRELSLFVTVTDMQVMIDYFKMKF